MKSCDTCFWCREKNGKRECKVLKKRAPMEKDNGRDCVMYIQLEPGERQTP